MERTTQRLFVYIAVSTVIGFIAVVMSARWMDARIASATTPLAVASSSILPGERLGNHNVRVMAWPLSSAIAGGLTDARSLDGRVALSVITPGEPILETRLAPLGSRAGLNALIRPGYRAMTVKVNEVVGVAGFALPGNYVDILVSVDDGAKQKVSKIVLEKILVLAVAQEHAVKDEMKPRVVGAVTLEVTPEQSERLDLARSIGQLSMALRNQTDLEVVNTVGAKVVDVLSNGQPKQSGVMAVRRTLPVAKPSAPEVWRGLKRSLAEQS